MTWLGEESRQIGFARNKAFHAWFKAAKQKKLLDIWGGRKVAQCQILNFPNMLAYNLVRKVSFKKLSKNLVELVFRKNSFRINYP